MYKIVTLLLLLYNFLFEVKVQRQMLHLFYCRYIHIHVLCAIDINLNIFTSVMMRDRS